MSQDVMLSPRRPNPMHTTVLMTTSCHALRALGANRYLAVSRIWVWHGSPVASIDNLHQNHEITDQRRCDQFLPCREHGKEIF